MHVSSIATRIKDAVRSKRGRDILVFFVFLLISAILWSVLTFNEENQFDVRMPVRLTHVPDSVTVISNPPSVISASVRAKGTQVMKQIFGNTPTMNIDFRVYKSRDAILLGETDLKALVRSSFGGASVLVVSPDSISLAYSSKPGVPMPISIDSKVTAGPQSIITGRPSLSTDSTLVFATGRIPYSLNSISTEPIRLTDLDRTTTTKVRLVAPNGIRVIPDSVDVTFPVEPLISKTRKVVIEPVNVPDGIRLITFPAQIEVFYMVPMSIYTSTDPRFRVLADYNTITRSSQSHKIKLRLRDVPAELHNVQLSADSAEYIIERQ